MRALLVILMTTGLVFGFQHGDRPAPNPQGARSPVLGMNGMVATSQPLASSAALRVLQEGGNAVDAAITAAAVLNVVEPMMTGIGGDMFALVYMQQDGKPVALNGSGWAGSAFDASVRRELSQKGHNLLEGAMDAWGGYQGILIDPKTRVLMGGSDVRKDGLAIGW